MMIKIRDDRHMRALTGLSQDEFWQLVPQFGAVYEAAQWADYEARRAINPRARRPGGGAKGNLPTIEDKLLFLLFYYKSYPTFDGLGTQFHLPRSKACEHLHRLSPLLHQTLVELGMMPRRQVDSPEELQALLKDVNQLIIDATERAVQRAQDDAQQRAHYSGKKTAHAQKHAHHQCGQSDSLSRANRAWQHPRLHAT